MLSSLRSDFPSPNPPSVLWKEEDREHKGPAAVSDPEESDPTGLCLSGFPHALPALQTSI